MLDVGIFDRCARGDCFWLVLGLCFVRAALDLCVVSCRVIRSAIKNGYVLWLHSFLARSVIVKRSDSYGRLNCC